MPNLSYALWSIWIELPLLHKLFFIVLFAVAVYSLFSAAKILAGVRFLMAFGRSRDVPALQNDVAALYARSANVRHLITATFYLFGPVFFAGLRFTLWTPDGKTSSLFTRLGEFLLVFCLRSRRVLYFLGPAFGAVVCVCSPAYMRSASDYFAYRIAKNPTKCLGSGALGNLKSTLTVTAFSRTLSLNRVINHPWSVVDKCLIVSFGSLLVFCFLCRFTFLLSTRRLRLKRCSWPVRSPVPNENSVRPASDAIPRGEAKSVSRSRPCLSLANEIRRCTRVQVSTVRTLISKPRGEAARSLVDSGFSGSPSFVAVMQPTDLRYRRDGPHFRRLNRSWLR